MLRSKHYKGAVAKAKQYWAQKCEQLLAHKTVVEEKDAEISSNNCGQGRCLERCYQNQQQCGKALPVDSFKGSDPELRFNEWPIGIVGMSKDENLMQLAGHLCGKAAYEYSLSSSEEKQSFITALQALRVRLDSGSCLLAAQECTKNVCQTT